jgi:hypothetical protein
MISFTVRSLLLSILLLIDVTAFPQPPTITSFIPATGPVGTLVNVSGTNLSSPTAFNIGGITAIAVSNTGTQLVGMVMPGAVTGTISVTTASGTASSIGNFTVTPTPYPSAQQSNKLVGTGNIGAARQGYSISVSADGNTAIVGGPADNSQQGTAWVFTRSSGVWSQQGGKLVGTGNVGAANQGVSVSLSADGNTAIVGGNQDNSYRGAAWIFIRSGGVWSQQGSKLVGTGGIGASQQQGYSVSLSADGNTAIVGGDQDNSYQGASWIFVRSGGVWTQQGGKLVGTGNTSAAFQGISVSLSADGNTALVGGSGDNSNQGASWIFTRSGGVWTQQSRLVGSGNIGASSQGFSVALSSNGNTAIVGGYGDNLQQGAAWVFIRSGGVWSQQGSKLVGMGNIGGANQGISVSLSADGNTAVIGGWIDNYQLGAIWVFTRSAGAWSQQGSKLVGTGSSVDADQGTSVSLSADGSTVIEGGSYDNNSEGAAWVFIIDGTVITWTGGISSNWTTGGNWSSGSVPSINDNVTIPTATPYSPIIFNGTIGNCKNITIQAAATLTIQPTGILNISH